MSAKVDKIVSVRVHMFLLLLACICLGITCCWYAARTSEVYNKMRNVDFYLPKELKDKIEEEAVAESEPESGERSVTEVAGITPVQPGRAPNAVRTDNPDTNSTFLTTFGTGVTEAANARQRREVPTRRRPKYHQLKGTPIEAIMSVFENTINAIEDSNSLCYATGVISILSAFWFLVAHCLIFESGRREASIRIINWIVYFTLIALSCCETVLLSKKMAMIPVMKNLADTIPLDMEHDAFYVDFISLCGTLGPMLIANMYLVIVIVSWFQARIVLTKFFSSIYEAKETQTRGPFNGP